jgi:hypothetical protein
MKNYRRPACCPISGKPPGQIVPGFIAAQFKCDLERLSPRLLGLRQCFYHEMVDGRRQVEWKISHFGQKAQGFRQRPRLAADNSVDFILEIPGEKFMIGRDHFVNDLVEERNPLHKG